MTAIVLRGDARELPLPDDSVDLIVTSPPYWGLRDYRDGDASLVGQIGSEPTSQDYLNSLWACTREWMRVLKPEGSIFVVLGDKYSDRAEALTPRKSRLMLPERYRIGCVDLGLLVRAVIVWSKPSPMPENVTDRVRTSHEDIVHLNKQPQYFASIDAIRAPEGSRDDTPNGSTPLGALPGSVWEIASTPLKVPERLRLDHFAAYPFEIPRRIITGWSPAGICTECGEGRRPLVQVSGREGYRDLPLLDSQRRRSAEGAWTGGLASSGLSRPGWRKRGRPERVIVDYACACAEPAAATRPAVVLDPFGGTGTTALVASVLGRHGISVDRSADYCRIAQWRTTDRGERARAMGKPKPPPEPLGDRLFEVEL